MSAIVSKRVSDQSVSSQPLAVWNDTDRDYPWGCVHELFQEQAERTPNAVALTQGDERLSYRELSERANRLAHFLQRHGVGLGVFVGLLMEQSIEAIVAVMGILKAGGAYVPFDSASPKDRLQEMVETSRLRLAVSTAGLAHRLPPGVVTLCLDRDASLIEAEPSETPASGCTLDNPAYALYTSGSTGKPKGVIGVHRSIVNGLLSVTYARDERCCLNASLSFGLSLANLFLPLMGGIALVILANEQIKDINKFVKIIEREAISRVVLIPPVFKQILELPDTASKLRNLREVSLVGATFTPQLLKLSSQVLPHGKLHNVYSSTEIGTLATLWDVTPQAISSDKVVIGRPVANTHLYLLDESMNPVTVGAVGDIYIGALHLSPGYLNQPELTAERFVRDPFTAEGGRRLLRTGDLGRLRPDGEIEFVGRADEQVKIRGYRIELAEVERALAAHEGVRDAAAAAREMGGDLRLIAYIVPDGAHAPSVDELRDYLRQRLPEYMIPSAIVFLDRLPSSDNGKVDRAALPQPDSARPRLHREYEEPRDPIETVVAEIWSEVLGLNPVGINDSFLKLGGDSLFAVQVASRVWDRWGVDVPLNAMFELGSTVAEQSAFITTALQAKIPMGSSQP